MTVSPRTRFTTTDNWEEGLGKLICGISAQLQGRKTDAGLDQDPCSPPPPSLRHGH